MLIGSYRIKMSGPKFWYPKCKISAQVWDFSATPFCVRSAVKIKAPLEEQKASALLSKKGQPHPQLCHIRPPWYAGYKAYAAG